KGVPRVVVTCDGVGDPGQPFGVIPRAVGEQAEAAKLGDVLDNHAKPRNGIRVGVTEEGVERPADFQRLHRENDRAACRAALVTAAGGTVAVDVKIGVLVVHPGGIQTPPEKATEPLLFVGRAWALTVPTTLHHYLPPVHLSCSGSGGNCSTF